jgi:hypothetical protein
VAANAQANINPNVYPPYRGAPVAQQPWEWHAGPGPSKRAVSYSMNGTIDRVTGAVEAGFMSFPKEGWGLTWTTSYALKCRPTQRMF